MRGATIDRNAGVNSKADPLTTVWMNQLELYGGASICW